jgi:hypothetical protein
MPTLNLPTLFLDSTAAVLAFGGLYDPWAPGGGDIRVINNAPIAPGVIFGYLLSSPFGGDGWVVRVDNLDDVVAGHVVVGVGCLFGGVWHISTAPWSWASSPAAWCGLTIRFTQASSMDQLDPRHLKLRPLHSLSGING